MDGFIDSMPVDVVEVSVTFRVLFAHIFVRDEAESAVRDLEAAGVPSADISPRTGTTPQRRSVAHLSNNCA